MNKRNTFFKQVDRFINEHSIGQIILAGDYNDIKKKNHEVSVVSFISSSMG
jgi:hypothetical protein